MSEKNDKPIKNESQNGTKDGARQLLDALSPKRENTGSPSSQGGRTSDTKESAAQSGQGTGNIFTESASVVKDAVTGYTHKQHMTQDDKVAYDNKVSRVVVILCVAMFVIGLINMCAGNIKNAAKTNKKAAVNKTLNVSVLELEPTDYRETVNLNAELKTSGGRIAETSPVNGTLISNAVKRGDVVSQGDVLGIMDGSDIGVSYKEAPIYAHNSGVVVAVSGVIGQKYPIGTTLYQIETPGAFRLEGTLSERDIGLLTKGASATFYTVSNPDVVQSARLSYVAPSVNQIGRTVDVELEVTSAPDAAKFLKPGMFVSAEITKREILEALVVPVSAVSRYLGKPVVFVERDGIAKQVEIEIAAQTQTQALVSSGLDFGDRLIVAGSPYDGAEVKVIE